MCTRYKNTFARLRSTPAPHTAENREAFTKLLETIYDEHSATLIHIAKGLKEIQASMDHDRDQFADRHEIQKIFDEFFISRIGIRMVSYALSSHFLTSSFLCIVFTTGSFYFCPTSNSLHFDTK